MKLFALYFLLYQSTTEHTVYPWLTNLRLYLSQISSITKLFRLLREELSSPHPHIHPLIVLDLLHTVKILGFFFFIVIIIIFKFI